MFFDWMVSLWNQKWFFYGIAVKNLLSTFIFKSVALLNTTMGWPMCCTIKTFQLDSTKKKRYSRKFSLIKRQIKKVSFQYDLKTDSEVQI